MLSIPFKRVAIREIQHLDLAEIQAVLKSIDRSTRDGRRDRVLISLLFNTGARVSEIVGLKASDLRLLPPPSVLLQGKGSARQLVRWLREEAVKIPRKEQTTDDSPICWRLPTQAALTSMLKNAVYAGAYVFGKSKRRAVLEHGRERIVTRNCSDSGDWEIMIRDHHPGYISWEQYERNVAMLRQNVNMKGCMAAGGIRGGASVFAGILRCGQCGRPRRRIFGRDWFTLIDGESRVAPG